MLLIEPVLGFAVRRTEGAAGPAAEASTESNVDGQPESAEPGGAPDGGEGSAADGQGDE